MSRVRSVRAWGPSTGPTACALAGRHCSLWGWRKGFPRGDAVGRCEGRLGSGAPRPLAPRPPGGLSGSATHVLWARVCGCWGPALAPWGVARHGGGGGSWVQAPPLPCCPPSGRAAGARWPPAVGAGVAVCGVCGACAVLVVARGVAFRLSLWCPALRCFGAVLCSPCACPAPFPARVPCSAACYPLFLSWLRRPLPFPPPFSLACTFSLPPLWCVSQSFSLPARLSLSLGPVRQRKDGGTWAFGGLVQSSCNILYPRWHHVRCGCVLRCAAYNIPVFALVSTCVRTLLTLCAIPWCACPLRWRLCCACGDRPVCCVPAPSPALMAYREREEGGVVYFALVVHP